MPTAALDLRDRTPPFRTVDIDLLASDLATLVILPSWVRQFSFRFEGDPGKYSSEGTAGLAIDPDYQTVPADTLHSISLNRASRAGGGSGGSIPGAYGVFIASAAGGTIVRMTLEAGA